MRVARSMTDVIGKTPTVSLERFCAHLNLRAEIYAKLEFLNPAGSVKDRAALYMLNDAESRGLIKGRAVGDTDGECVSTIIEPTSGNTGIGLCAIGAARGYRVVIVMPDTTSVEKQRIMKAYGAQVVLTPGSLGMSGAIDEAKRIHTSTPGSIIIGQFSNPANAQAHYETTAPELWADTDGSIDAFVAGVGTGGTLSGIGRYLKEKRSDIQIVAVEPTESPLLSRGYAGSHDIQGIGANFVPEVLDMSLVDRIITVDKELAYKMIRLLARTEGILAGPSSGAALGAAVLLAEGWGEFSPKIGVVLPDSGERYLSMVEF